MKTNRQREREVTRAIHRLFWEANFRYKYSTIFCWTTRIPAMILLNVIIPLQTAFGIEAIVTRNFDAVSHHALMIFVYSLAYAALWGIGGIVISKAGAKSTAYIQEKVFSNYLTKDYDFYTSTYFGSLGAQAIRIRDAFIEYNQLAFISFPKQIVVVLAGVIVIAYQSALLAVVTLVAMTIVLSFTVVSSSWRLKYRRQVSEASSEVSGVIGDALSHAPTVKSFAAEGTEEKRLAKTMAVWCKAQYKSWVSSIPADSGRAILAALTSVILLLMTARLYQDNSISIAVVALVQLYVIRLVASTLEIAEVIKTYEHAMGGAYQPVQTMLINPGITDKPDTQALPGTKKLDIAFRNVTYRYPDAAKKTVAVADFNLAIKAGQKVGLVGFSGSGKTTLTKLLLRFMDTDKGTLSIAGINITDLTQQDLREHIAYVPQEPLLFHRSIFENIAYGKPGASPDEVRKAATMAHIDEFIDELPKGYDTLVGERGVKLSGGQRQRVAIARAILKDAPILVLDEATSALDSQSEQYIQQALWNLMKDRTALVIAHRLSTIQRLDTIVVMDKGRIVQEGTHEALLKQKQGPYARLWAHQSGGYIGDPSAAAPDAKE